MTREEKRFETILGAVLSEVTRATEKHRPLHSAHEAYAVILEEVQEFWAEVMKKRAERSFVRMRDELIQVAAMAVRTIYDLELGSTVKQDLMVGVRVWVYRTTTGQILDAWAMMGDERFAIRPAKGNAGWIGDEKWIKMRTSFDPEKMGSYPKLSGDELRDFLKKHPLPEVGK